MAGTVENTLSIRNISKHFPGVKALDDVSFEIRIGEVHAICGENGAGKSTLMNILSGNYHPDSGTVTYRGEKMLFSNPYEAQKKGVAIVHQERSLVGSLSVADNIFVNRIPRTNLGTVDSKAMYRETRIILDKVQQYDIEPRTLVNDLTPAQQQMIEICKALVQNPKVLILDEPTATITEKETVIIFQLIKELKQQNVTIIYISHRMQEIFQIGDRVTILRDGRYQATYDLKEITVDDVIRAMVGREISNERFPSCMSEEEVLRVEGLKGGRFEDVSFKLHKGEILGFAGLAGAGRTEVARAIFGADPLLGGDVFIKGKKVTIKHPSDAIKLGVGYLPEDRKQDGLFQQMSVEANIISGNINYAAPKGLMINSIITNAAEKAKKDLDIKTPSVKKNTAELSGGNQQKVVIGKWLLLDSDILIVDEPTRGIDIGTKREIFKLLHDLVKNGKSIIMISSDLPEVLLMSDNIIVMYNGKNNAYINNRGQQAVTEEYVLRFASGLEQERDQK